jgi:hypothetical protein
VISHWNETAGHWKCNYKLGLNLLAKSNIYNFLMDITMVVAGALDLDDTCDSLSSWPSFLLRDWRRREEAPPLLSFVLVKLHWIEPTPFWKQKEYQINVNYVFQGYTDLRCHPSDKENPQSNVVYWTLQIPRDLVWLFGYRASSWAKCKSSCWRPSILFNRGVDSGLSSCWLKLSTCLNTLLLVVYFYWPNEILLNAKLKVSSERIFSSCKLA